MDSLKPIQHYRKKKTYAVVVRIHRSRFVQNLLCLQEIKDILELNDSTSWNKICGWLFDTYSKNDNKSLPSKQHFKWLPSRPSMINSLQTPTKQENVSAI